MYTESNVGVEETADGELWDQRLVLEGTDPCLRRHLGTFGALGVLLGGRVKKKKEKKSIRNWLDPNR